MLKKSQITNRQIPNEREVSRLWTFLTLSWSLALGLRNFFLC